MKFNKLFAGFLAAAALTACSNDPLEDQDQILENETTTYVRISLIGDKITGRDTDPEWAEMGTDDENAVNSMILTFYDAGRKFVARTPEIDLKKASVANGPNDGSTVEKIITIVAKVDLPEKANRPHYVLAYVNPTSKSGDLATEVLENATTYLRARTDVSPDGYRTMNNSVYFDESANTIRYATVVDFNSQFATSAEDAVNKPAVEITIERMEAKVRLNAKTEGNYNIGSIDTSPVEAVSGNEGESTVAYTLEFTPTSWFVNATEKNSFLIKNFRSNRLNYYKTGPQDPLASLTYTELQSRFSQSGATNVDFNDAERLRSYWAISPTYFDVTNTDTYPDHSYDVTYPGVDNKNGKEYPLYYRSYDDAVDEYNKAISTPYIKFNDDKRKTHEYVLENTMCYPTLQSSDAMASMTSVVLTGYYTIKKGGDVVFNGAPDSQDSKDGKSFYVHHELVGETATTRYEIMLNDDEAIDFFLMRTGSRLYVAEKAWDEESNSYVSTGKYLPLRAEHLDENIAADKKDKGLSYGVKRADFKIEHPTFAGWDKDKNQFGVSVTGTRKLSEQWRTLMLSNYTNKNLYIFDSNSEEENKYRNITVDDMDQLDDLLYSAYGIIERFETGKAYFNVPLKHIWGIGNTSNAFDPSTITLGHYGVVRNHIYDLTINKITGLGTGIGDTDQPIIPPTKNETYYISTKLNILKWRVVSQKVDL